MSLFGWLFRNAPRLLVAALCLPLAAAAATYTFRSDSYAWETAATVVSWDRSCTGYPNDDDKATLTFTGGFTFTFAGTAYGSVRVLSNGMLQFGADTGFFRNYSNTTLPAGAATARSGCVAGPTTNVMMAYWTDLDPGRTGSGNVTWEQKGTAPNRYVVVSWNSVYAYNTSTPYAFQIILYENGQFKYQYGNSNASGSNATVGVQVDSTDYTLYSYNSGYNANGSAIRWFIPSGLPGRVAEYRFDEFSWNGSVGEVRDSSGNDQHGVRVGSATNEDNGVVCRRLNVPANTTTSISAIDTALDVDTGIGSRGTLSFWVRANANWASGPAAMLMSATMSSSRPFDIFRTASGALTFLLADSTGKVMTATTANQSFTAGTWVHIAATWRLATGSNQSTLRLYVNGVQLAVDIDTTNGNLDPSLGSLFVGDNRSTATATGSTANSANGQLDELRVYNFELSPAEVALDRAQTHSCDVAPHHLEIQHGSGTGLTCTPSTVTIVACLDAACASRHTNGVTATLTAAGAVPTNFPAGASIVIPPGSSSVDVAFQVVGAGSTSLGIGSASPPPVNATSCNFGSPSCTFTAADSGFQMSLPNHAANSSQTLTLTAVRKADNAAVCVPAFANVTRAVALGCSYVNPTTGTRPVRAGGVALNSSANAGAACGGTQSLNLSFDGSGRATTTALYADVGQVDVNATYTGSAANGDSGLSLAGSARFIAAPASFSFTAISAGPIKAGRSFSATVNALDSGGATTPNFGREITAQSATISFQRAQPTGGGANDGSFTGNHGTFTSGSATASNLVWSEVGRGDLRATLTGASYLGSGLTASGSTGSAGAVGRFVPDHFDVVVTPSCSAFTYAGQPFAVRVMAMNGLATPGLTLNYDGSASTSPNFAQTATLSEAVAIGAGSFGSSAAVAATAFTAGVGNLTPTYTYTDKLTGERILAVRLTDADTISSTGFAEGSTALRSGRLRVANAFGIATAPLQLPVLLEYWSGNAWVLNAADNCTTVPASAIALSNRRDHKGAATSAWSNTVSALTVAAGRATLTLGAPSPAATGVVDLSLNLGSTATDRSCLASPPASTGAARPWLRSLQGSCAATWDRDPAARASFGIYSPETRRTVHVRDLY